MIKDVFHFWGDDLTVSSTGDLLMVDGTDRGQQRVLRRLMTNPGDYVFHPDYGAGLPAFVGQTLDAARVAAVIRAQMLLEESVAKLPPPVITVATADSDPTAIAVTIQYNDAADNEPVVLSFTVSN